MTARVRGFHPPDASPTSPASVGSHISAQPRHMGGTQQPGRTTALSAELEITITPTHQRCAATLAQGFVEQDEQLVNASLTEIAGLGPDASLAVAALMARHLAFTLVELVGTEAALRQLERTRLDAAVAE